MSIKTRSSRGVEFRFKHDCEKYERRHTGAACKKLLVVVSADVSRAQTRVDCDARRDDYDSFGLAVRPFASRVCCAWCQQPSVLLFQRANDRGFTGKNSKIPVRLLDMVTGSVATA